MSDIPNRRGIYKITCKVDGKIYVGGIKGLRQRKNQHFYMLKKGIHKNHKFQKAYNLYGKENFEFKILEFVDDKNKLVDALRKILDENTTVLVKGSNSMGMDEVVAKLVTQNS